MSEIIKLRNLRLDKFKHCRDSVLAGSASLKYFYESKAVEEVWNSFKNYNTPRYHQESKPNPFHYQYDLELYIFIHYDELKVRELELETDNKKIKLIQEFGPTLVSREKHLSNAASIRWPGRLAPNGRYVGDLAITPWLMDYYYGVANYNNVIEFGGAGQGKTYGPLSFMCMIYDYFINTQKGAQCTFSTVSESKLQGSTWVYLNRLYDVNFKTRRPFSLVAGTAKKGADYTYNRILNGKKFEQGGMLRGVLIPRGRKDSSVVDKLTGFHDPEARIYLLDEMQSTEDSPLSAYNNMFLHCKHGWFNGAGNYDLDGDLLSVNVEPNQGWDSTDETTHMWEGTLKTRLESLDHKALIIHFNNELSPGMTDPKFGFKYANFVPTPEKKKKLYPTADSQNTIAYKRFWIGYRFEKEEENTEYVLTSDLIETSKCHESLPIGFSEHFVLGSFDSAPASVDRNAFGSFGIGMDNDGYPIIYPKRTRLFKKPRNPLKYYSECCDNIINSLSVDRIEDGHFIMDWTARPAHIEMLATRGFTCHHLIYQEKIPDKEGVNKITGDRERAIPLETIPTFLKNGLQKDIVHFAHQTVTNKITLGAYIFRMFVEAGRIRCLNSGILTGLDCQTFEKEFLKRKFIKVKRVNGELLNLDSKEEFKAKYGFSPDILDLFYQVFYMLYVIYDIRPNKPGLGKLRKKNTENIVDNYPKLWKTKRSLKV